jgi:hypothetical protein
MGRVLISAGADILITKHVHAGTGPTQSLLQWLPGFFHGRSARMSTHLQLVPILRLENLYVYRPPVPVWNVRDKFTALFIYLFIYLFVFRIYATKRRCH